MIPMGAPDAKVDEYYCPWSDQVNGSIQTNGFAGMHLRDREKKQLEKG